MSNFLPFLSLNSLASLTIKSTTSQTSLSDLKCFIDLLPSTKTGISVLYG